MKQLHGSSTELLSISAFDGRIRICEELDNNFGSPFLLRFLVFYLIKQNHVNCGLFTPSFTPFTHISPFHFFRRVRLKIFDGYN